MQVLFDLILAIPNQHVKHNMQVYFPVIQLFLHIIQIYDIIKIKGGHSP